MLDAEAEEKDEGGKRYKREEKTDTVTWTSDPTAINDPTYREHRSKVSPRPRLSLLEPRPIMREGWIVESQVRGPVGKREKREKGKVEWRDKGKGVV